MWMSTTGFPLPTAGCCAVWCGTPVPGSFRGPDHRHVAFCAQREEQYIFPYQESADVMFNSALIYELAVLKIYAEPLLFGIGRDQPEFVEAKRLLKFLDYFVPIPADHIPNNSLVREFIGGSCFDV